MTMLETLHEYQTTLNGGIVTVVIDLSIPPYLDRLVSVCFEDVDVSEILDKNTLTALSMEAEQSYFGDNVGDFDPARDAHRLGD
jgi:hypothetical protein